MKWCRHHATRYRRLWRLPSVRMIGTMSIATIVLVAFAASLGYTWLSILIFVIGVVAIVVKTRQHDARLAVELHIIRTLRASRQGCPVDVRVPGLRANVNAQAMPDGVTQIAAESWLDGITALGFITARDRGFQMDRMRRMASGRLSEIWGKAALPSDARYRSLNLAAAADRALKNLEQEELDLLEAFASGVAAAWNVDDAPFECRFLSCHPEPWTPGDSLLIALLLYHGLSWNEQLKRADSVIRHAFPDEVARFFLPDGNGCDPSIPEGLDRFRASTESQAEFVSVNPVVAGSNCWVQREPGGSVLACDLHLSLSMPNSLYEIDLRWSGENRVRGLIPVGLPVMLTGTNGHLAWGVTNLCGDLIDLIQDQKPQSITRQREHIRVRGRPELEIEVASADAAILSPGPLMGKDVFVRWTGFDARSCDLKFQRLAHARDVDDGIAILDQAQGIALNVLFTDTSGRMAHLATGLLPRRTAESPKVADDFLSGSERPRIVDPPDGQLVSANDSAFPENRFRIGYDFDPGHRAARVRQLLSRAANREPVNVRSMQHDTRADLYQTYRDIAVSALQGREDRVLPILAQWNGCADVDSRAFGVLVRLRQVLAKRILSPYLAVCLDHDRDFLYAFQSIDRPVLAIIRSGDRSLLPPGDETGSVKEFIARCVDDVVTELNRLTKSNQLPTWGEINLVGLHHPIEELAPWSRKLLGVASRPQAGALHCVRTCVPGFGAVGRAILRPGNIDHAEFETPGGQSGHPLNRHYDDRHSDWSSTRTGKPRQPGWGCKFVLRPDLSPGKEQDNRKTD